jgi:hypothetical protein
MVQLGIVDVWSLYSYLNLLFIIKFIIICSPSNYMSIMHYYLFPLNIHVIFAKLVILLGFHYISLSLVCVGVLDMYEQKHSQRRQEEAIWRSYTHQDLAMSRSEEPKTTVFFPLAIQIQRAEAHLDQRLYEDLVVSLVVLCLSCGC